MRCAPVLLLLRDGIGISAGGGAGNGVGIGSDSLRSVLIENISGANRYFRANRANFNLSHQINIQGHGGLDNFIINRQPLDWVITLLQISPPTSLRTLLGC